MVFRRSLVRELTATAVGLFLVLLGILFTNLVLRLLARAAGGTVAPEGILALLGFNALFYFNILLSVALFLTVLLTLSRWYRDSEMIVWFTSGQGLTAWLKPILWFASPFLLAIVVLSLWLSPWAEAAPARIRAPARVARRAVAAGAGTVQGIPAGASWSFSSRASTASTGRSAMFSCIPSRGDKDVTTVARSGRLEEAPEWRPLYRAAGRPPLRRSARAAPNSASRSSSISDGGSSPPKCARSRSRSRRCRLTALVAGRRRARARRTVLAHFGADQRISARAAGDPALLRQSAHGPVVQPVHRAVRVHALQQLPQHRAELHRAGPHVARRRAAAHPPHRGDVVVIAAVLSAAVGVAAGSRGGAPHENPQPLHRSRSAVRDAADLRRAAEPVRVLRSDPRARQCRQGRLPARAGRCCSSA